jgi:hypothetical protein
MLELVAAPGSTGATYNRAIHAGLVRSQGLVRSNGAQESPSRNRASILPRVTCSARGAGEAAHKPSQHRPQQFSLFVRLPDIFAQSQRTAVLAGEPRVGPRLPQAIQLRLARPVGLTTTCMRTAWRMPQNTRLALESTEHRRPARVRLPAGTGSLHEAPHHLAPGDAGDAIASLLGPTPDLVFRLDRDPGEGSRLSSSCAARSSRSPSESSRASTRSLAAAVLTHATASELEPRPASDLRHTDEQWRSATVVQGAVRVALVGRRFPVLIPRR